MNASQCRSFGVLAVHVVRQGDVDGVDQAAFQTLRVLLIAEGIRDLVLLGELFQFGFVTGNERPQF